MRSWIAIPPFIAELKFSGDAFRLSRWRTPETREQLYVETVLAREDHAKEVMLFGLGPREEEAGLRDVVQRLVLGHRHNGHRRITIELQRSGWAGPCSAT